MPDNLQKYLRGTFPGSHAVLGEVLRPLAVGHVKALLWTQNHYLTGGELVLGDLINAVWICRQHGAAATSLARFATAEEWALSAGQAQKDCDLNAEAQAMRDYFAEVEDNLPPILAPGEGRPLGSPHLAGVELCLFTYGGVHHRDVDNFPYLRAIWLYATQLETSGAVRVEGTMEREHFEAVKKMEEELEKEDAHGV